MGKTRKLPAYRDREESKSNYMRLSNYSHLLFAACFIATLFVYRETWLSMEHQWSVSSAHGHGYLIAPIALWLTYRKRHELASLPIHSALHGLVALLISAAVWLIGEISSINLLIYIGVVAMIPALILLFYGREILKTLMFPLAFLFFMVPAGDFLIPMLMKGTTEATVWALSQSGLPVYREGNHLSLPTGRWSVIETCAGLNYVIAASVLGVLYAYLTYTRRYKQVVFLCLIMFIALIVNWIRAYLTILTGHLTNMKWGPGHEHVTFGWIIFGVTLGILFWVCSKWADPIKSINGNIDSVTVHSQLRGNLDFNENRVKLSPYRYAYTTTAALSALAILITIQTISNDVLRSSPKLDESKTAMISQGLLPVNHSGFRPEFSGWRTKIEGQIKGGVQIFIAYYAHQTDSYELASSENRIILENGQWISISSSVHRVESFGMKDLGVREDVVKRGNNQFLVWYWYTTSQGETSSLLQLKLDTLRQTLMGGGDKAALSSISYEIEDGNLLGARANLREAIGQSRKATEMLFK